MSYAVVAPKVNLVRLRELREGAGFTQADVATTLGYKTRIGYAYIESGRCRLTAEQAAVLAQQYGIAIEALFCGHEGTTPERNTA